VYEIDLTAAEMNHDRVVIKLTSTNAADSFVAFRMFTDDIDAVGTIVDNIETDTQDIQSRLPAALVTGRMSSDAVAISGSTTAADNVEANIANLDASVAANATPAEVAAELATYDVATDADVKAEVSAVIADTVDIQSRLPAALVTGRMSSDAVAISGSTTAADNVEANIGNLDAAVSSRSDFDEASDPVELATTTGTAGTNAAELVDLIWDEDVDASHQTAGSAGKKLDDAGTAADPWTTALPGAYGAGTGGYLVGTYLDAAVSGCSGAGASVVLGPVVGSAAPGDRFSSPVTLQMFQHSKKTFALTVTDADGEVVDLSAKTLRFVVHDASDPTTGIFDVEDDAITISGDDNEVALVPVSTTQSATAYKRVRWVLWDVTSDAALLLYGSLEIRAAIADVE